MQPTRQRTPAATREGSAGGQWAAPSRRLCGEAPSFSLSPFPHLSSGDASDCPLSPEATRPVWTLSTVWLLTPLPPAWTRGWAWPPSASLLPPLSPAQSWHIGGTWYPFAKGLGVARVFGEHWGSRHRPGTPLVPFWGEPGAWSELPPSSPLPASTYIFSEMSLLKQREKLVATGWLPAETRFHWARAMT